MRLTCCSSVRVRAHKRSNSSSAERFCCVTRCSIKGTKRRASDPQRSRCQWRRGWYNINGFFLLAARFALMLRNKAHLLLTLAVVVGQVAHAQDRGLLPGPGLGQYRPGIIIPEDQVLQQQPAPPVITNIPGREPGRNGQQPASRPGQPGFQQQPFQAPLEPEEKTEFQEFINASTGRALPIFGQSLFRDVPSTFAPVENIPVAPDYTIGPGDELYIRAWGQIDIDYLAVVDRNGMIAIPRVGVINLAGVRHQDD